LAVQYLVRHIDEAGRKLLRVIADSRRGTGRASGNPHPAL
jgi:hypothetical protein